MVNERNILIWFSYIGNVNYDTVYKLKKYFGSLESFWYSKDTHIYELLKGNRIIAEKINKNRSDKVLFNVIKNINNKDFHIITINDVNYPKKLLNIYNPPYVLYFKGKPISNNTPMLAIVGSRKSTAYGRWAAYKFSKELVEWGITIVSGMALGIDSEGHKGALDGNGNTIAVLGCGIDKCYPLSNFELMNSIIANGTLISEYYPGIEPLKHHFPLRNRIISGLSDGIIVIEAADKSGSLITVEHGLEQGKEIFALPGNINNINSSGTNKLIKDGAKMLLTVEDIVEDLKTNYPNISKRNDEKSTDKLSKKELMVYNIIKEKKIHIDLLQHNSKIENHELRSILKALELKGYIKQLDGNMFTVIT